MAEPKEIIDFWLDEVGPKGWYAGGDELDGKIRERFEDDWHRAMSGACGLWLTYPSGALAYLILTDQFPRNMFRDTARAFASDAVARSAAKLSIAHGFDTQIDEPARVFFYMPLMHSECLADQDRCIRLMKTRMPEHGENFLRHARAHREVIRLFGRFPTRNDALSRAATAPEADFVRQGGYRKALELVSGG